MCLSQGWPKVGCNFFRVWGRITQFSRVSRHNHLIYVRVFTPVDYRARQGLPSPLVVILIIKLTSFLFRYFRAAYSALCGNVNVLKSVCSTWEDLLWAHTKCLVDTNVEQQIREILGENC